MPSFKHLYSLDYLRGIAAVSVSLFHFTDKLDYLPNDSIIKTLCSPGHYGVEIFFIISGVVIPYSMEKGRYHIRNFFTFFKKRIIRIEPPYLVCVLLALLLNYLTTRSPVYNGPPFEIDYIQLFSHLGYLNNFIGKDWLNPVFWTLAIEFQYYLLIALFFPLISSKKWYQWIPALLIFNCFPNWFDRSYVFHFSIYFTIGIIIYRYLCDKHSFPEFIALLFLAGSFVFTNYGIGESAIALFTTVFILSPVPKTNTGKWLGNISYSLYLLHFPIGLRIINITQRFTTDESIRIIMIAVALIISIIFAWAYFRLLEQPFKKMAAKISYKKEGGRPEVPVPAEANV